MTANTTLSTTTMLNGVNTYNFMQITEFVADKHFVNVAFPTSFPPAMVQRLSNLFSTQYPSVCTTVSIQ